MKKILSAFLSLIGVLVMVGGTNITPVAAGEHKASSGGTGSCYSLDVMFIIDQSSSMSGPFTYGSDPTQQRKFAVDAVIDQLSDIALDTCPDTFHRIGVVSFGGRSPVINLPLSNINPDTVERAESIRESLKPKVEAKDLGTTKLPHLAFQLAKQAFDEVADPPTGGPRKRVIIFITDGIPNPVDDYVAYTRDKMKNQIAIDYPFDETLLKQENCLKDLRQDYEVLEKAPAELVNACLKDFALPEGALQKSTYIFTIFLEHGGGYPKELITQLSEMSDAHGGKLVQLSKNRQDIPTTFRQILSQLAGVKATLLKCGNFAVNPYLRQAKLNFFKLDSDLKVNLTYVDAAGKSHTISGGQSAEPDAFSIQEYTPYGANERYVIDHPYPGIWQLTADDCSGLDAYYDPVAINPKGYQLSLPAEIAQYEIEPYFDEGNKLYLEYQMQDSDNKIIEQSDLPVFKVDVQATVTDPNQQLKNYAMEWQKEDQVFRSVEPLQFQYAGVYKVAFDGSTRHHEGEPLTTENNAEAVFAGKRQLFHTEGLEFKVFPVDPFKINVMSPAESSKQGGGHQTIVGGWPLKVNPVTFRARFENKDGVPLEGDALARVIDDIRQPLVVSVSANGVSSEDATFAPDPDKAGEYIATVNNFGETGTISATVKLTSTYNNHYRPAPSAVKVNFNRQDDFLSTAFTYQVALLVLIGIIILIIIYNISIITHVVKGKLVFRDSSNAEVLVLVLGSQKRNWYVAPRGTLKQYPDLDLDALTATDIKQSKVKASPDGDYGSSDPSLPNWQIKVVIRNTIQKTVKTYNLRLGDEWNYSDDAFTTMRYEQF